MRPATEDEKIMAEFSNPPGQQLTTQKLLPTSRFLGISDIEGMNIQIFGQLGAILKLSLTLIQFRLMN